MQDRSLPAWLTKAYLEPKLRSFYKDDKLQILKLWSKAATAKGENFIGIMTRLHVEYTEGTGTLQQKTYILKEACSKDAPGAELFGEYNVYEREMDMYEFVLPKMGELLQEVGITEKLYPDALCVDRDLSIILLEDLAPLKYRNADRLKQLDMEHTKLAVEMLAKFHASSTVLKQRHPEILAKNFSAGFFSRGYDGYNELFSTLFKGLMRYVKSQPKLNSRYYKKLQHVLENLREYAARSYDVNEKDFQTLVHGDCWILNVMFKYDDKDKPFTVLPIDFQFSTWTSPCVDLHYFFCSSLSESAFNRLPELVQHHYYALKENLEKLNYKGIFPSLHEYHLEFERRRFMAVLISTLCQPLMIYEGSEDPNIQNLYEESPTAIRFQDSIYESERAQNVVAKFLALYDAKGLLDPL